MKIFEAHANARTVDFYNMEAAQTFVEKHGEGRVVTFIRGSDNRDRSCAMKNFHDGKWRDVDIFGGGYGF